MVQIKNKLKLWIVRTYNINVQRRITLIVQERFFQIGGDNSSEV